MSLKFKQGDTVSFADDKGVRRTGKIVLKEDSGYAIDVPGTPVLFVNVPEGNIDLVGKKQGPLQKAFGGKSGTLKNKGEATK